MWVCSRCGERWQSSDDLELWAGLDGVYHKRKIGPDGSVFEFINCGPVEEEGK